MTLADLKAQEKAAKKAEKERQKRIDADEKAERKRAAKTGFSNPANPTRSMALTIVCAIFAVYCLFPFVYLMINATKTQSDFTSTFGLGFGKTFALFDNIATVFTYQDGIFGRWFVNTILYVVVGAGGATLLAIMGGYALAKFRFPGRKLCFVIIIGAISVPGIALAVPQFLLFAKMGLTNTPWSMIIPSLVSTFGLYLMWIFSDQAVPDELLEAARVDGAGEFRTFFQISLPLLAPCIVRHCSDVEQLLPAVDHVEGFQLVPVDDRSEPVEGPGFNRRRSSYPKPRDYRFADHDHPSGDCVPVPAEVLAVRPRRRRRQGVTSGSL